MGTVAGVNTRRYHALLLATFAPPADRYSILPRVEERVSISGETYELATVQYPGIVQPRGCELLEEFAIDPFPRWRYQAGGARIEKTVCLMDGRQSVLVRYQTSEACVMEVRLLLAFRDYHSLGHRNAALQNRIAERAWRVAFKPYEDLPELTVFHNGIFSRDGLWFLKHEYLRELDRGLDFREDLFSPGSLRFEITPEHAAWFIASLESQPVQQPMDETAISSILETEAQRRAFGNTTGVDWQLRRALDQFRIIRHDERPSLIAGYPWFTDWSRDTLISLPALFAAGFGYEDARKILEMLLAERSQGLLPNRFSDTHSAPEYNSADATLWLFAAAHELVKRDSDESFLRRILYPAARDIIDWHRRGTHHRIGVDGEDHLLSAGGPDTQLTWMDARVGEVPVTPRYGKAVEINALWYNALKVTALWAGALGAPEEQAWCDLEAAKVLASFRAKFWNAEDGYLYDVVVGSTRDSRIRPNQLLAVSLPFPMLEPPQAQQVVRVLERELLTPVGLRTLDRRDTSYQARFEGSPARRDAAYHQGTVWPWLIGPFMAAYLYAFGETEESLAYCRTILNRVGTEFTACCLGSLAEVYDGEPPQRPAGCPAQLWSVAQFIIAWERLGGLSGL